MFRTGKLELTEDIDKDLAKLKSKIKTIILELEKLQLQHKQITGKNYQI